MHEMSLVRPIVNMVLEECADQNVRAVTSVHLTIGDGHDVIVDMIPGLFQFLARGTIAEHAEVVIERVPLRAQCNRCGAVFPINVYHRETWVCPSCGEHDYRLFSGREFRIDSIRVEGFPADSGDEVPAAPEAPGARATAAAPAEPVLAGSVA